MPIFSLQVSVCNGVLAGAATVRERHASKAA
jgi:hypothetical protein